MPAEVEKFKAFCALVKLKLEGFQLRIAEEIFSARRECLVMLPRGCGKSTLLAAVGLFALLSRPDAKIVVAAASGEQASVRC